MRFIRIFVINLYITLVFSLTLELLSFKIRVYFLVLFMAMLSIHTNLNYKLKRYDFKISIIEV